MELREKIVDILLDFGREYSRTTPFSAPIHTDRILIAIREEVEKMIDHCPASRLDEGNNMAVDRILKLLGKEE